MLANAVATESVSNPSFKRIHETQTTSCLSSSLVAVSAPLMPLLTKTDMPPSLQFPAPEEKESNTPLPPLPSSLPFSPVSSSCLAIRCVITDMDGTFLNKQHIASSKNAAAFGAARKAGFIMGVATGRSFAATQLSLGCESAKMEFQRGAPGVYLNGQVVLGPEGELVFERVMSESLLEPLLKFLLLELGLMENINLYTREHSYCFRKTPHTVRCSYIFGEVMPQSLEEIEQRKYREGQKGIGGERKEIGCNDSEGLQGEERSIRQKGLLCADEYGLSLAWRLPVCKIMILHDPPEVTRIRKAICSKFGETLYVAQAENFLLEVLPGGESKGKGVWRLLKHMGLRPEEVLALGDSENDLEMLQLVGVPVAMDNAMEKIKEVAKFVIGNNDRDGFAEAMQQLLGVES